MNYLSRTHNSNTDRLTIKGRMPKEVQGLLPPRTKKRHTEQYAGRETTEIWYWDSSPTVFNLRYQQHHVENAVSKYNVPEDAQCFRQFVEVWEGVVLKAVLCSEDYISPTEHIKRFENDLYRRGETVWEDVTSFQGINSLEDVINLAQDLLEIPVSFDRKFMERNFPRFTAPKIAVKTF